MPNFTQEAPALIGVGAQSIVDRAKELGLTWTIRPATISTTAQVQNTVNANETIVYDGDSAPIAAMNITGQVVTVGQRVMAIAVPPAANYIIGFATVLDTTGRGLIARISSFAQTGLISAETIVLSISSITFVRNRAYAIHFEGTAFGTVAAWSHFVRIRLTGTSGTLLAYRQEQQTGIGAQESVVGTIYVVNTSGGDETNTLVLTSQASAGSLRWGTNLTTDVYYLEVTDVGAASQYAGAISV